jgi:predicted secreted protein
MTGKDPRSPCRSGIFLVFRGECNVQEIHIGETASGKEVTLRLHQKLIVRLPEARTAGFRWNLGTLLSRVCTMEREEFEPPPPTAGGAGTHVWHFKAEQAGNIQILIEYRRPWERAEVSARFVVSVRVH